MKLFTEELYLAIQEFSSEDADGKSQVERRNRRKAWQRIVDTELNEENRSIANQFHDAKITSILCESDSVEIKLSCNYSPVRETVSVDLAFSGVTMVRGVKESVDNWWLLEEIYPIQKERFGIMVLMADDENGLTEMAIDYRNVCTNWVEPGKSGNQ